MFAGKGRKRGATKVTYFCKVLHVWPGKLFNSRMSFSLPNQQRQNTAENRHNVPVIQKCLRRLRQTRLFFLCTFNGDAGGTPLLQLWRRDEAGGVGRHGAPATRLPPVVVVLADHLQYVADCEVNAGLLAWNELITDWIELKQCSHEYLTKRHKQQIATHNKLNQLMVNFQHLPRLLISPKDSDRKLIRHLRSNRYIYGCCW